jgi:hypothetical protein
MAQVVECLPIKYKSLSSKTSTTNEKKNSSSQQQMEMFWQVQGTHLPICANAVHPFRMPRQLPGSLHHGWSRSLRMH